MSIKKIYLCGILFTLVFFLRCNSPLIPQQFSHYTPTSQITKVEISNVNGSFTLNDSQLIKFRKDLGTLTSVPNLHIKTGSLMMILTLENGETFVMRGNSESKFLEVSSEIATENTDELYDQEWIVYDTNGVNFNNYRKR